VTATGVFRPNYREGQYLGPSEFVDEQAYHRGMRRRLNLTQHTWGIYTGLELVTRDREDDDALVDVFVAPGFAIDGFGREIVVMHPEPLDPAAFRRTSAAADEWVPVWLRYLAEATRPPAPGFELCDDPDYATRTRETFTIVVGHLDPSHEDVVVDGRATPDAKLVPDTSIPHQSLPDRERALWLVPLGQVQWDGANGIRKPPDADRPNLAVGRVYGGAVAAKVLAPARALRIADRATSSPLPANDAGVSVAVEGSQRVERQLGVGADAHADVPLTVRGLGPRALVLAIERPDGQRRWHVENQPAGASPGLNVVETGLGGSRLFLREGGGVGVGTLKPFAALAVRGLRASEELVSFEDTSGATKWHINSRLGGTTPGFNLAETGVLDGRLFVAPGGNVGLSTTTPAARLDAGGGDVQWAAGSRLTTNEGGSIELGGNPTRPASGRPAINFHYQGLQQAYNTRIVNDADGQLTITAAKTVVTGNEKVGGIAATMGREPVPYTPGWGGGVRTWDVEAEGTIWSRSGFEIGDGAGRRRVPIDVQTGLLTWPSGGGSGANTFAVTSRLPNVVLAEMLLAPEDVDPDDRGWLLRATSVRNSPNSFTFTITRQVWGDGVFYAVRWLVVFAP
jgi:hypothetical protein